MKLPLKFLVCFAATSFSYQIIASSEMAPSSIPLASEIEQVKIEKKLKAEDLSKAKVILEKAEALLTKVNADNKQDLKTLWSFLSTYIEKADGESHAFEALKEAALKQLMGDLEIFKELHAAVGTQGEWPWRSSLGKLVGNKQYSGILEDAMTLLHGNSSLEEFGKEASGNKSTVLKTALIYLASATGKWTIANEGNSLQLAYPAKMPSASSELQGKFSQTVLCSKKPELFLIQPNCGFVFGGNFFSNEECRGVDCSSFVSYCIQCSERLSTFHMELIWKALINHDNVEDATVAKVLKEFQAIDPRDHTKISEGDLVIWRSSGGGHVVIFEEWADDSRLQFRGYEATREDDKSKEGLMKSEFSLFKPEKYTYVLRRI